LPLALAIHGGAWNIPDEAVRPSHDGVRNVLDAAWRELRSGATALDVVERAVRRLEDDPMFDAGRGSRLNRDGEVELDASIMEGAELRAGAVAAVQHVRHPISVARRVMDSTPHVMLAGKGARDFAEHCGEELCRTEDLLVGRERDRYFRVLGGEQELVDHEFDPDANPLGTVGAVALDGSGNVAAATSTGGTQNKTTGRVGDTPVIGAGTYADNRIGAGSATGWGEGILRVVMTKTALDRVRAGDDLQQAAAHALADLRAIGGKGGLILVDPRGNAAAVFTTPRMARGVATEAHGPFAAVEPRERP